MKRSLAIALLFAALPWAAAGAGDPASAAPVPADLERAETLYKLYCAQCHGINGTGDGPNAAFMDTKPRDHTNRAEMGGRTDDELFRTITEGGKAMDLSVMMPAWGGNLEKAEIDELVRYLRVLCCTD